VRISDGDERKRSPFGGGNARASGYHYNDDLRSPDTGPHKIANGQARRGVSSGNLPEICPKSCESEKGKSEKNRIPLKVCAGAEGGI
jgi:hypothetical protein